MLELVGDDFAHREIARLIAAVAPTPVPSGEKDRTTVASRKLQMRQALEGYDVDKLLTLQNTMSAFVDLITESSLIKEGEEVVLDGKRAQELMARYLEQREIDEFMGTVKDLIRETVYAHLDAVLAAEGAKDPENTNGTLEVPELGRKFSREGAGYKDPSLDEARLQELLGDRWDDVCDDIDIPEQIIPAHQEKSLSVEKAMKLGRKDPAVMEILRACIIPGTPKTPRLWVRNMK
jgi:hypothetical protein